MAKDAGQTVRTAGAGHSYSPLAATDGIVVDLSGLASVVMTASARQTAWVWAGTRIFALGHALQQAGLALANQGDIDQQALTGATATGSHGTGATLGNLSSGVTGFELATASENWSRWILHQIQQLMQNSSVLAGCTSAMMAIAWASSAPIYLVHAFKRSGRFIVRIQTKPLTSVRIVS